MLCRTNYQNSPVLRTFLRKILYFSCSLFLPQTLLPSVFPTTRIPLPPSFFSYPPFHTSLCQYLSNSLAHCFPSLLPPSFSTCLLTYLPPSLHTYFSNFLLLTLSYSLLPLIYLFIPPFLISFLSSFFPRSLTVYLPTRSLSTYSNLSPCFPLTLHPSFSQLCPCSLLQLLMSNFVIYHCEGLS